jgi:hypothetical protein
MKGHSGGVPSAVEAPPAEATDLTKSSQPRAVDPKAASRANGGSPRLTATRLKRGLMIADSAMLLVGFLVATTLALHRPQDCT